MKLYRGQHVDTVTTGGTGNKLMVSLMDMAALLWLEKLDRRLLERVMIDCSVQIKNRNPLSQLVPTIAKALPGMIKNLDSIKKEIVNYISSLNLGQEQEDDDMNIINRISTDRRGGRRGEFRRNTRGATRGNFNDPNLGLRQSRDSGPRCAHCTWLKEKLGIKEIDNSHPTSTCNRLISAQIRAIVDNSTFEDDPSKENHLYCPDRTWLCFNISVLNLSKFIKIQTIRIFITGILPPLLTVKSREGA